MNSLDIVLLLLFLPGIIRGLSKGFLEQGISLAGIVASVWLAFHFSGAVCLKLKEHIQTSETILNIIAFVIILVGVSLIVLVVAKLLTGVANMASLGWLNRLLGMVFSLATSALILSLGVILFDTLNIRFGLVSSPVLSESLLYAWLKDLGYLVFPYLKQLLTMAS